MRSTLVGGPAAGAPRAPSRGHALAQRAKATSLAPALARPYDSTSGSVASTSQQQPAFTYAPGEAGRIAQSFVEKVSANALRHEVHAQPADNIVPFDCRVRKAG